MSTDLLKKEFVPKYLEIGSDKFYRFLLSYATNKLMQIVQGSYKGISPEIELLDYYDRFIILYRREGDDHYLDMAKLFRKAAHKIYRVMIKKKMVQQQNSKFLNLV